MGCYVHGDRADKCSEAWLHADIGYARLPAAVPALGLVKGKGDLKGQSKGSPGMTDLADPQVDSKPQGSEKLGLREQ